MSNDEVAVMVRERLGCLVVGSSTPRRVGEVVQPQKNVPSFVQQTETIPLAVVGNATRAEYEAQAALIGELLGIEVAPPPCPYFYHVEAAD